VLLTLHTGHNKMRLKFGSVLDCCTDEGYLEACQTFTEESR